MNLAVGNMEVTSLFIVFSNSKASKRERLVNVTAGSGVRNSYSPELYASKAQKIAVSIDLCITIIVILDLKATASILLNSASRSSTE